jgi:hypothetical protein
MQRKEWGFSACRDYIKWADNHVIIVYNNIVS